MHTILGNLVCLVLHFEQGGSVLHIKAAGGRERDSYDLRRLGIKKGKVSI